MNTSSSSPPEATRGGGKVFAEEMSTTEDTVADEESGDFTAPYSRTQTGEEECETVDGS